MSSSIQQVFRQCTKTVSPIFCDTSKTSHHKSFPRDVREKSSRKLERPRNCKELSEKLARENDYKPMPKNELSTWSNEDVICRENLAFNEVTVSDKPASNSGTGSTIVEVEEYQPCRLFCGRGNSAIWNPQVEKARAVTYPPRNEMSNRQPLSPISSWTGVTRHRSSEPMRGREYKLSELLPDCRLRNIEARGGERDFTAWFKRLPPNIKVDKDIRTDRGVFKKDNFPTSRHLDKYLGIKNSKASARTKRHRL